VKGFLVKVPEGMLERWKEVAAARGISVSLMIREAVNKSIDEEKK
jgi:predicted DNA-binding protein